MADAVVHIGPIGAAGRSLVSQFYQNCGLEVVGPGRITTGVSLSFDTLEQLLDHLTVRTETYQVIVCHGNPTRGLLVPFATGTPYNATGPLIRRLGGAAHDARAGASEDLVEVTDLASFMGVSVDTTRRLIAKLARLPGKILEFRGCNLGSDRSLLRDYRDALNGLSASAPKCRMFYVPVLPHRPPPGGLHDPSQTRDAGTTRRRTFLPGTDANLAMAGTLVLDVIDVDGHTKVKTEAFMDAPSHANAWARAIDGAWALSDPTFVTQVLWDDHEASYHVPLDVSYREHLVRV
jgi:hypothetical protein